MFNHQYNFNIEIPKQAISEIKHEHIFGELLNNKVIIGLMGYGKSGKDTIAKTFIDNYGFHRVAFADNIKIEMNQLLKNEVFEYLENIPNMHFCEELHPDVENGLLLEDGRTLTLDMLDFTTEDIPVKKRLRPFIIWYGEKLREINGPCYWINKAFEINAAGYDNIILSDVRRPKELDVFMWSNNFKRKSDVSFIMSGIDSGFPDKKVKSYSTLLFHVNQFMLQDSDALTHDCIRIAQENWIIDHTFYIDPRLPESGPFRNKSISMQIKSAVGKFGINIPDKTIAIGRQGNLFN